MAINGISTQQIGSCTICYIDNFSDDLKELIRQELNIICHGKQIVATDPEEFYSYKKTLKEFLKRYRPKDKRTRMGMIGELLSHLIFNKELTNFQTISVFFNKEERSIKKGFDLNYINITQKAIWYGEVKSGKKKKRRTIESSNKSLLVKAKNGLVELLNGERDNLWDSAIIDAGLNFFAKRKKKVQELLRQDITEIQDSQVKKNSILISVLFYNSQRKINLVSLTEYLQEVIDEDVFQETIIFTIQKSTLDKIERFLRDESRN